MKLITNLKEFYIQKEWIKLLEVLKLERINENGDLLCEHCGKPIDKKYDCIGHHVIELTLQNVNDVNISLNPNNIKLIHFRCHNMIHRRFGFNYQRVYIVYGSPLSGKTSWVKENATKDDIILDLDNLYQAITINQRYEKNKKISSNIFQLRDCMLDMIKTRQGKWNDAYVIGGYPSSIDRKRLSETLGATLIHIDTPKEECLKRLEEDTQRNKEEWVKYINDYWDRFQE